MIRDVFPTLELRHSPVSVVVEGIVAGLVFNLQEGLTFDLRPACLPWERGNTGTTRARVAVPALDGGAAPAARVCIPDPTDLRRRRAGRAAAIGACMRYCEPDLSTRFVAAVER